MLTGEAIGTDAAPVNRATFEVVMRLRPSILDRSRRLTDTSKAVTNPRISA